VLAVAAKKLPFATLDQIECDGAETAPAVRKVGDQAGLVVGGIGPLAHDTVLLVPEVRAHVGELLFEVFGQHVTLDHELVPGPRREEPSGGAGEVVGPLSITGRVRFDGLAAKAMRNEALEFVEHERPDDLSWGNGTERTAHGLSLPRCSEGMVPLNPMPYEAAIEMERALAEDLHQQGYAVWQA